MPTPLKLQPVPFHQVRFNDPFFAPRRETNRNVTLPHIRSHIDYLQCFSSRSDGLEKSNAQYWNTDLAKWIEATAYEYRLRPNKESFEELEHVARSIAACQQADGFLQHSPPPEPIERRWRDMRDNHRLYSAGHFIEAAVAWYQASNSRSLLDIAQRYADHISTVFGTGLSNGYCGHPEIELALARLYDCTGESRYLELAKHFIDQRGQTPNFFQSEEGGHYFDTGFFADVKQPWSPAFTQSHLPIRDQRTIEGHAVRALYLFSGATDVAAKCNEKQLLLACRQVWENLTEKRIYITGGIGSSFRNEGITTDYDLPNIEAYCETCASVAFVFWCQRMLHADLDDSGNPNARYADWMEQTLYNNVASGVSISGNKFFYWNKLHSTNHDITARWHDHRQHWFECPCCPPNVARLLASLGSYAYSFSEDTAAVHLYASGTASLHMSGALVTLHQTSNYPWSGEIDLSLCVEKPLEFSLLLRIPAWCREWTLSLNGEKNAEWQMVNGYVVISRMWKTGDSIRLLLDMPPERRYAHPEVKSNQGRVALQRGPIVYCFEEVDNGSPPETLILSRNSNLIIQRADNISKEAWMIQAEGFARGEWKGKLYSPYPPELDPIKLTAIPYCMWDNREIGEMLVWIREA